MKIGIAICTFNRIETLKETIRRVQAHTKSAYELIVVDDGSSDDTYRQVSEMGVCILSPRNRGIAWNKNRALFYLKEFAKVDAIILLEDDTFPLQDGWEHDWVTAIDKWGHVNLAARYWGIGLFHDGDGTPMRPYKSIHVSAQCAGFSSQSLDHVGYMDSRFRGWGMEHVEHTNRFLRAGFGGEAISPLGRPIYYLIDSNMEILFREESVGIANEQKRALIEQSIAISSSLRDEKIFRNPWYNNEEMVIFLSEINKFRRSDISFFLKNDEDFYFCFNLIDNTLQLSVCTEIYNRAELVPVFNVYDGHNIIFLRQDGNSLCPILLKEASTALFMEDMNETVLSCNAVLDTKSGMYLQTHGYYLSCEKASQYEISINREIPGDWERFFFSHFKSAPS